MITVLISTTYNRLLNIKKDQFPLDNNLRYIISCQGKKNYDNDYYTNYLDNIFIKEKYTLLHLEESGLSNNRNNGLNYYINFDNYSSHCYIADDDIKIIVANLLSLQKKSIQNNIDLTIGKIITEDKKNPEYKKYPINEYEFDLISASKISSVEMLISKSILLNNEIKFDPNFGLGTTFPSGEEYIFATDIIKNKGKVYFYPINICIHPFESSGKDFFSSSEKIIAKGAMLCRIFGQKKAKILAIIWAIKKFPEYKKDIGFFAFIKQLFSGINKISLLIKQEY